MKTLLNSSFGRFRILAFCEGISFLLILFVTMPLKYFYQWPEPNKIVGMAHGILFLYYLSMLIPIKSERLWTWKETSFAAIASVLPFGTFIAERYLFQKEIDKNK